MHVPPQKSTLIYDRREEEHDVKTRKVTGEEKQAVKQIRGKHHQLLTLRERLRSTVNKSITAWLNLKTLRLNSFRDLAPTARPQPRGWLEARTGPKRPVSLDSNMSLRIALYSASIRREDLLKRICDSMVVSTGIYISNPQKITKIPLFCGEAVTIPKTSQKKIKTFSNHKNKGALFGVFYDFSQSSTTASKSAIKILLRSQPTQIK